VSVPLPGRGQPPLQPTLRYRWHAELADFADSPRHPRQPQRPPRSARTGRHLGEAGHHQRHKPAVPEFETRRQGLFEGLARAADVAELEAGVGEHLQRACAHRPETGRPELLDTPVKPGAGLLVLAGVMGR
jgi:hypothetical protein